MAGVPGANLKLSVNSTDLSELRTLVSLVHTPLADSPLPVLLRNGAAHFDGSVNGSLNDPQIAGILALTNFQMNGANWQSLHSSFNIGKSHLALSSFTVQQDFVHARATGRIALTNWGVGPDSALRLEGQFSNLDIKHIAESPVGGLAAGTFALNGTVSNPTGNLQIQIANFGLSKEHLDSLAATVKLKDGQLQLTDGKGKSGGASVNFTGTYEHEPGKWDEGILSLGLHSDLFPISSLLSVRQSVPDLSAQTKIDLRTTVLLNPNHFQLRSVDGSIALRNIAVSGMEYGNVSLNISTHGPVVESSLEGNFRSSRLSGTAQLQLTPEMPVKAQLQFGQTDLQALAAVFLPAYIRSVLAGSVRGDAMLEGPLQQWEKIRAAAKLEDLQISSPDIKKASLILHNSAPISLQAENGILTVQSMKLSGRDTDLSISGAIPLLQNRTMQLKVDGAVDLHLAELFYPNLQSSGESKISAVLGGTLNNPTITGTTEFRNGRASLNNFSNELTDLNGTIQLDRNRATLQNVTAHSGGGNIALSGFVTFSAGHPLVYGLEAASQDVRIRYANGISITGSSQLALTGTSQASVLSGTATVSRVIFNPDADAGALLASTVATGPIGTEPDFLSGLQFDIHVDSAPNLQLSTSLSRDVQAALDLQLRGNPKNPVLLGSIEANEGDIRVFGGRYSINRGQISFTNPAKIEPVLDLDLRTQTRGINVDITVSGTLSKLNINYRSDPPLQPRDIIALLAVGRTPSINPNTPNTLLVNNDTSALQSGANTVLGQAVSPNSSRLQKLFGIANIKIDPLVQGITNTSQARLTLEQQISRQITVTYVTNLSQTSEQIFRLEYALNPQFSLIALRDDNGEFGLDILYKKRFK
ncbi:MAG: translocation/assembly module TamB, partial [Acidobacteriaceae bacterium]|nr:translocation/assembly module TamB [Acidobacteriaceae bacterium]